ncbi:cyclic nucleotide-binding domain-containing protein [Pseudomonas sp. MWU12-2323]|uniref:cyclic nucleotide-binding domain-containing protein n=1 Tax=Pseudomonas sp. MWU12-2323 TaxID=2651296 RepID=UPI00128BEE2C|nr:cyclic nucleotide-binding domain-containing protein [Pseudomonas sp. MWU12-2323]MPQ69331.1 cyclic nucleotide-binding domain-containing protein [Pseudomonas sp. MWU12-2323]
MSNAHISNAATGLQKLFKVCSKKRMLKKRELIIPYLETPKCLFVVQKGSLRVALSNIQSDGIVCISHLKPGDLFGEQGLFDSAPMQLATATIQARCDVELLCVTHDDLKRAAQTDPGIYAELSAHINNRLGETTAKLLQLVFEGLEQRCYQSLVEITRLPDALTHPDGMQISLTRIELAQMIGCNRESAGRVLKTLREKGLIDASGSRIVVHGIRHGVPVKVRASEGLECV